MNILYRNKYACMGAYAQKWGVTASVITSSGSRGQLVEEFRLLSSISYSLS